MKLPTFRRDAASGLAKAQAALAAAEQRITELEVDRRAALAESDANERNSCVFYGLHGLQSSS
jgi:Tfp pilus assembly protein PilX